MKAFLAAAMLLSSAYTAAEMYMPIKITSSANDLVGSNLVNAIKKEIEESPSLRITNEDEVSLGLNIVTLDGDNNHPGNSTRYVKTTVWNVPEPSQRNHMFQGGTCGLKMVDQCAQGIVANLHKEAERLNMFTKQSTNSHSK